MNKIIIDGEIGFDTTAAEVKNQLKGMSGDLVVEISSVGGSVYNGIEMFNALKEYKGHITTVNKSMAASMASYIMLVGDTVKAYSNSTYMIHNAVTFTYGNASELRKTANHLESLSEIIAQLYVSKTNIPIEEVKQMMDDETFLYGEEMLTYGFVDEIISAEQSASKKSAVASIKAEYNSCLASSKGHCKIEGYNKPIENIWQLMPTEHKADKMANKNSGVDMETVSKEEFDAIQSKYDSLVASNDEASAKLGEATAKVEDLEKSLNESNKAEIIAFCGANRSVVNFAKEKEFLDAGAKLQDVMDFAMEADANAPVENLDTPADEATAESSYLAEAIAKQNKGEL